MLRYCKSRISNISNRSEDASKGTVPLCTIQEVMSDKEIEDEITFGETDTPEAEEKCGGKKRRQFFQRLRQIAAPLSAVSELEEDEDTYTEDGTISDVEEEDDSHFVTSFDLVGMNDSAVAITVMTEMDSVRTNQDKVVDDQVKEDKVVDNQVKRVKFVDDQGEKRGCFRGEDIWTACKVGDEDFVKNAIANDPTLVHLAKNGRTPLYNACLCGHERIVKILLEAGAQDLDRTAYTSALDFVENAIADDPTLAHLAENGRTPLYNACLCGHEGVVKILLEAGAQDLDRTAYISALNDPCRDLLHEHESNQRAQIQEEIAKRLVDDREKGEPTPETAAILKDLAITHLDLLDNDVYAGIDCTSIEDDYAAGAEADHNHDTGDTDVDTPVDIGRSEASMNVGADCDAVDSNARAHADVEAADKKNMSAADVEAIEESFDTLYSVSVPFQSHLVRTKDGGFEAILEPVVNSGKEGNDIIASDVSFDPRVLNDAVQAIRVFTGQDSISGGPLGSSPASDGNISSKLDKLNAKCSSPSAKTTSLLAKYNTDATLSTDGQTFASEGDDSFLVDDAFDTGLPFMSFDKITEEIENTFYSRLCGWK
jgi:hypothetical protein